MNWKSYPKYRDSGIEWLEQIPKHWNVKKQAWNFRSAMGQTILKDDLEDDGEVAVYSATESGVIFGRINNPLVELNKGDIVIPARGVSIGYAILIKERSTCTQTTIYCKLLTQNLIHSPYIRYYMLGLRDLLFYYDRTAIPQITVDQVSSNPLLIPPVFEQNIIEIFLDHETTRIDVLLEKKEKQIELLQEKRQAIITQAVTKGLDSNVPMKDSGVEWLGKIPKHWEIKKLKRVGWFKGGAGFPIEEQGIQDEEISFFKVKDLELADKNRYMHSSENTISRKTAKNLMAYIFPRNSIVFAKVGAALLLNRFRLLAQPSCMDNNMMGFIIVDSNANLNYLLLSIGRIDFKEFVNPGAIPSINNEQVEEIKICFPKIDEQKRISIYITDETRKLDTLMEKIKKGIELIKEYRSALITAAVTGKIDVRDFVPEAAEKTEIIK